MTDQVRAEWRTLFPAADDPHGPLPQLLVLLTVVTGLVDAYSYLELGRVFVANMTGNVIFLAFATGGAPGFVWWASVLGIAAFSVGAFLGGRIHARFGGHRARHLFRATTIQWGAMLVALVVGAIVGTAQTAATTALLILVLGIGMGIQKATARALAVPDLTTTVLTLTITGVSADSKAAGGKGSRIGRRFISILSMFVGGAVGSALVIAGNPVLTLTLATVVLGAVVLAGRHHSASTADWTN